MYGKTRRAIKEQKVIEHRFLSEALRLSESFDGSLAYIFYHC